MRAYNVRSEKIKGTTYSEIERKARSLHNQIAVQTKRNAYVRSDYFKKDKVFIRLFWEHLHQKHRRERLRRLRYYACAIELLRNSRLEPISKENPNKNGEILHRFVGVTSNCDVFYVQVKEYKRNGNKYFMSVFPSN